jgi:starvation-inducible outer membrane lipoprotein
MTKAAVAAAIALMISGCATVPVKHQVNRTNKADKYVMPKKVVQAPMPTPNQVVEKRWFPKFKIKWVH